MKSKFPWLLIPSKDEFKELWDNCVFVFDTNVLLDLYRRYPRNVAEEFLDILEEMEDRIWLPNQVAFEFLRNRQKVIAQDAESFHEARKAVDKWVEETKEKIEIDLNSLQVTLSEVGKIIAKEISNLDVSEQQEDCYVAVDAVGAVIKKALQKRKTSRGTIDPDNDQVFSRIASLFSERVGDPYDEKELLRLYKNGEQRYRVKMPPGFADAEGKKAKDDLRKYGDFILWRQILDFSSENDSPVILITGESQQDWWDLDKNGNKRGPRVELCREFYSTVGRRFWMYGPLRFMDFAREHLGMDIDQESIDEVRKAEQFSQEQLARFAAGLALGREALYRDLYESGTFDTIEHVAKSVAATQAKLYRDLYESGTIDSIERVAKSVAATQAKLYRDLYESGTIDSIERMVRSVAATQAKLYRDFYDSGAIERVEGIARLAALEEE